MSPPINSRGRSSQPARLKATRWHSDGIESWPFYVYALTDKTGLIVYVGKGSGYRLTAQRRTHQCDGYEIARFRREVDAYAFERELIAQDRPSRNRCAGGNGSRVCRRPIRRLPSQFDIGKLGSRRFCAKFLLENDLIHLANAPSEVDGIRHQLQAVLNGPWC